MLDISEVRNAINENDSEIYIIKSTCPVGTVDMLKSETGKRIIFSPEYYGGTQHCNNFDFNFHGYYVSSQPIYHRWLSLFIS